MIYGCVFCQTGKEAALSGVIEETFPHIETLIPKKKRIRRVGRERFEESVILFPGYVFFRMEPDSEAEKSKSAFPAEFKQIYRWSYTYRLLTNVDGDWRLTGADLNMAKKMFEEKGAICFSKAYFDEGNRIRVLEGFLKDYEGDIVRVDRRHCTAEVQVDFQGRKVSMWLGYELIERRQAQTDGGRK